MSTSKRFGQCVVALTAFISAKAFATSTMETIMRKRCRYLALCAFAYALPWAAELPAMEVPTDEYSKLINSASGITSLNAHPFGESVDLYSGALSFSVTDISVPGIGPTLTVGRTLKAAGDSAEATDALIGGGNWRPFGDWDLDIPRIETTAAFAPNLSGWQTDNSNVATASNRCTIFRAPPPAVSTSPPDGPWDPVRWWYGYHLIVPGYGDQLLLSRDPSNTHAPTSGSYPIVTKQDWMIGCGVAASDGGEGFLAVAPDGTQYTFAHLVYRPMPALTRPNGSTGHVVGPRPYANDVDFIARDSAAMYVTKIQDRFGNTITYNWSGNNLSSIVASDGRKLNFTYVSGQPWIQTITQQAADTPVRTWTYSYGGSTTFPSLTGVQLPDGSAWSYQMGTLESTGVQTDGGSCKNDTLPTLNSGPATGSMTTPTGLSATFTITPTLRGRSYVPKNCWSPYSGSPTDYAEVPNAYYQYAITSEVLSGPGLPAQTWTWSYSAANQSWLSDPCGSSCAATVYTDIVDPSNHNVRYTFSNRFDASEGLLVRKDEYSGAAGSTILRTEIDTYATGGGSWPFYGNDLQNRLNHAVTEQFSPLSTRAITQDGATFTFTANSFDGYARVTKQTESSTLGFSRTVSTTYYDDATLWVLGQVSSTAVNATASACTASNAATTSFSSCILYDSTTDLPRKEYNFGLLVSTKGWNADGTLSTIADGLNNTTTMSNWKRGVPQTIQFADNTTRSAVVNDDGWVTSVTDENGYATSYAYDAMGRITKVTYPTGDTTSWNAANSSFAPVNSAEYGLVAGHWKLTQTTGNYRKQTFYDARWRPVLQREEDLGNSATVRFVTKGFDYADRETFSSYPVSTLTTYADSLNGTNTSYDALGRVTQTQAASELGTLTTATQYLTGYQTQVTNPRGKITTTSFQAFDMPVVDKPVSISAPTGVTISVPRDAYGKPTSLSRSGSYNGSNLSYTRTYVYDGNQRLCKTIEPESGATIQDYDSAGNVLWSIKGSSLTTSTCDRGSVTSSAKTNYAYDALNRLTQATYPTGTSPLTQTYYPDGLPKVISTNGAMWGYTYNKRRLLLSEALSYNTKNFVVQRSYDGNGSLSSLSYPDCTSISFAPNALGQPTQAGSYATGVSYFPNGAMSGFTYGNAIAHSLTQNTRQLPKQSKDGSVVDLTYTYDQDADITAITDAISTDTRSSLVYDDLDRLTSATANSLWGVASYSYDPIDNLRTSSVGGRYCTHAIDGNNRLTGLSGSGCTTIGYGYDTKGNVNQRGGQAFTFDAADRMTAAVGLENYVYDGMGRRVAIIRSNGTRNYQIYSKDGQLLFGWDTATGKQTKYIGLNGSLVARVDSSGTTYIHTDGLHTPIAESNASGTVTTRNHYEPYGQPWAQAVKDGPGYTGHVMDASTGLSYMQQRYYDPVAARFLSNDSVAANAQSFNRYWYAYNNPYANVDPDGRAGKVAWLVRLTATEMKRIARLTKEEAVQARKSEQSILGDRKQISKQVETAAYGSEDQLRHVGHELEDGSRGLPHYQTEGKSGHSFWGKVGAVAGAIGVALDKVAEAAEYIPDPTPRPATKDDLVRTNGVISAFNNATGFNVPTYDTNVRENSGFEGALMMEHSDDSQKSANNLEKDR